MTSHIASHIFPVEFFTHSGVVSGQISCPVDTRLLDVINGTCALEGSIKGDFIEFVNLIIPIGESDYLSHPKEYIRKTAFQLLALTDINLGRGVGAQNNPNIFPFVQKTLLPVSFQLQNYTLIGNIHLDRNQTARDLLNGEADFLPLTEVTIAQDYHLFGTRPFVAVNKEHIISSKEENLGFSPTGAQASLTKQ